MQIRYEISLANAKKDVVNKVTIVYTFRLQYCTIFGQISEFVERLFV